MESIMKRNTIRLFLMIFAAGLIVTATVKDVFAQESEQCHSYRQNFSVYAGVEGHLKHMGLKKTFARELYNHKYFDGHMFGGLKFNENLGVEFGLHAGKTGTNNGIRAKSTGNHLMLLGFSQKFRCQHLELFAGPGISFLHNIFNSLSEKSFEKHTTVLRLVAGANYFLSEHLALRGTVAWENTNRVLIHRLDDSQAPVKPYNSLSLSAGLMYQF